MKRTLIILSAVAALLVAGWFLRPTKKENGITIGIIQTAQHPALDAAREGFISKMRATLKDPVHFVVQNADGSIVTAQIIAQKFATDSRIAAVYAIATPAALSAHRACANKPIAVAAVTDPQGLGLLEGDHPIVGSSDMIDIEGQVAMILDLMPQLVGDAAGIGIIYNAAEANSLAQVRRFKQAFGQRSVILREFACMSESELPPTLERMARVVHAVIAPTDNMVASAITLIVNKLKQTKTPFFVSDNLLVPFGAVAARGVDYRVSGKQAASKLLAVLRGKTLVDEPIAIQQSPKIVVNGRALAACNLTLPTRWEPTDYVMIDKEK